MSKEDFFSACALKTQDYDLNGYTIKLKGLTLRQRKDFSEAADDPTKSNAMLLIAGCDDLEESDMDRIYDLPGDSVDEMTNIIMTLSGFGMEKKD